MTVFTNYQQTRTVDDYRSEDTIDDQHKSEVGIVQYHYSGG